MPRIAIRTVTVLCLLFLTVGLMACGGGGSSSPGSGTLNLSLTDSSSDHYKAIYVTVAKIQVHKDGAADGTGNWQTILTPNLTYNLLDLVNGTLASLGTADLAAGSYDQLRLILGKTPGPGENLLGNPHSKANYFIDANDAVVELKVPSGLQTGIKIVGGFDIAVAQATDLVLDFDAANSIVQAGTSGQWLLKPTIKIADMVNNPQISGVVSDKTSAAPIAGSLVSAQVYPPGPLVDANGVLVQNATLTDVNGVYLLYAPPATYNVVAVKSGYAPKCVEVTASDSADYFQNFALISVTSSETGTVSGEVTNLIGTDASASISVLGLMDCGSGNVPVQVDSENVAEGGNFSFTLLPGDYTLVATAEGQTTQVYHIAISADSTYTQNIQFQ